MGKKGIQDLKKLKDFGKILEKVKAKGIKSKSLIPGSWQRILSFQTTSQNQAIIHNYL